MKRALLTAAVLAGSLACAQPFTYPENYAPTAAQGGAVNETLFGDFATFNRVLTSSAQETAVVDGLFSGPSLVYRDWLGNRSYRKEDGSFNLFFASAIEEVRPEQEFVITLKEGWTWSDGTEMTADDFIAAREIIGDPAVESNSYSTTVVGESEAPIVYEKLGTYQFRVTFPEPVVNALGYYIGVIGMVPAHIYMPVYEERGAEGIRALWGIDTPPSEIVSGGPYILSEFRPGERIVLQKNPAFGEFVQAAEVLGRSRLSIVFRDILPNALSPVLVLASLMVASAILLESALSFLGLGDPNRMSWGYMIGSGRSVIRLAWWMSVFPGVAIFLTVLALNLVGDGLADALNPRVSRRR